MPSEEASLKKLDLENRKLRDEVEELREVIRAVRSGEVDALVIQTKQGDKVFTLKTADQTYRALVEDMNEAAVILSDDDTILYCNLSFGKLTGRQINKIIGTKIDDMVSFAHIKNFLSLLKKGRSAQEKQVGQVALKTLDGSLVPTQMSTNSIQIESEKFTYLIFTNLKQQMREEIKQYTGALEKEISRRQELQLKLEEKAAEVGVYATRMEELAQLRANQLKDSERMVAIGQTAGMVGHDIRNPLQSIMSELYLAKDELRQIKNKTVQNNLSESVISIENEISYINKIVQDLQDYSKPLTVQAKEVNMETLFSELLTKNTIPQGIKVRCEISENIKSAKTDPDLLKRVLGNLVSNACQAMPDGGELAIPAQKSGKDLVISVQDSGVGIPKEIRPKLFSPLFTTKAKGQGFGLPVVRRVTETMGGTVTFESEVGRGTTFTIKIPLA